jgi:hypothetical protein
MQPFFKTEATINAKNGFSLSNLPFKKDEKVTVFVVNETELEEKINTIKTLFKTTQAQCADVTEQDIADEIAAYRAGL